MKRWLPWIGVAVAIQALVVVLVWRKLPPPTGAWQAISPIAAERVPQVDGVTHHNRAAVYYFWATWCEPCVKAWPETLATARALAGELDVWLVSRDAAWSTVVAHFNGEVPAQVVFDRAGLLGDALGVQTLPTSFLAAPNGAIIARGKLANVEGLRHVIDANR